MEPGVIHFSLRPQFFHLQARANASPASLQGCQRHKPKGYQAQQFSESLT